MEINLKTQLFDHIGTIDNTVNLAIALTRPRGAVIKGDIICMKASS